MFPRILAAPARSFFLFGPRGVGKSTWARAAFPGAHRVDLLDEALYQTLLGDPSVFAAGLRTVKRGSWLIVDEVQRLPSLLNDVHRFIEDRRLRFALLGSSARKLKTAGTNLLAGRALRRNMFPFVPAELGRHFVLDDVLRYGSLPVVWAAEDKRAVLEAYVQMYLREEIRAEAIVRNLPGFVRFLPVAALFHGQVVNVSGIARDAGTARTTVDGHLEVLEDTLLAHRLPAFEARLRTRERKHPKLYWIDPGLVRAARRQLGPVTGEEQGALFEGWVLSVLRAYAEVGEVYEEIGYWAPLQARAREVDFVLRRGRELIALEVKSATRYSGAALDGLRAIAELPRVVRRVLIYRGVHNLETPDGIEIWTVPRLTEVLESQTLWP